MLTAPANHLVRGLTHPSSSFLTNERVWLPRDRFPNKFLYFFLRGRRITKRTGARQYMKFRAWAMSLREETPRQLGAP